MRKNILLILLSIIILFSGCSQTLINTNPLNNDSTAINVDITNPLDVDGGLIVIQLDHKVIHDGLSFHFSNSTTLLAGQKETVYFKTNNLSMHLLGYELFSSASPMTLNIYENVTIISNGSSFSPINRNRLVNTTSTVDTYLNPTYNLTNAIRLDTHRLLGSKTDTGSTQSDLEQWLFLPNTNYIIEFVNDNGNNQDINYQLIWFEETFLHN